MTMGAAARRLIAFATIVLALAWQSLADARAHSQSLAYLTLAVNDTRAGGTLELAVRDAAVLIDLDRDGGGTITWGEVRAGEDRLTQAILARLVMASKAGPCSMVAAPVKVDRHGGEHYLVLPFEARCEGAAETLDYRLLFDSNAQHRALATIMSGSRRSSMVLAPDAKFLNLAASSPDWLQTLASFLSLGLHHILIGADHVLFVLTLLLGTAMHGRDQKAWRRFTETAKVVTAFTFSHSITLGLASLGLLVVPKAAAESLIAATIALAAVNNIWPLLTRRLWLLAFGFGLIHGLGFANVLADIGLPEDHLLSALLAFNLGVEAGQLTIVAVALPLVSLAATTFTRRLACPAANLVITGVGLLWLSDRVLGTALMPF